MAIGVNWKEIWDESVWAAVWSNEPPVEVPDVVGQSQASGTAELETALFVVAVATDYSSTVPVGDIISQSPTAGSFAIEGSTVTITVSLGPQPVSDGAGSSQRKKRRKERFFVDIDGQSFPVDSAQDALNVLEQARALAERQAEEKARQAEKKVRRKVAKAERAEGNAAVPALRVEAPRIEVSPEIARAAAPLIEDIGRMYRQAAMVAEMRLLLQKQREAEEKARQAQDDEDLFLLL